MFELSKIVGFLLDPRVLLFGGIVLGTLLLWTRGRRGGRRLITLCVLLTLFFDVVPIGLWAMEKLEYRFPFPAQLERVDGIVVLGGDFSAGLVEAIGARAGTPPRLVALSTLARRYPDARIIYSGGSGNILRPDLKEADLAKLFLVDLGVDTNQVIFENQARNTYENALYTLRLADPKPGERWILVTTAWHMPRAMGTFRRAGWSITPYPVDFTTAPELSRGLSFGTGVFSLRVALREAVGLVSYYLLGRSDALFPGPT